MDPDDELDDGAEEDLLVVLPLSNRQMGTGKEREELDLFADRLEAAITEAGVGEYDGNEIGAGEYVMFFAGPSIEQMLAVLHPVVHKSPWGRAARIRVRQDGETVEKPL